MTSSTTDAPAPPEHATDASGTGSAGPVTVPAAAVRRAPAAIAVGAALVLTALIVLLVGISRPGGPVVADESMALLGGPPGPPLLEGQTQIQRFTATGDGLSEISLRFGKYGADAECDVSFRLVEATTTRTEVAGIVQPCEDIPESTPHRVLAFDPIADSAGRRYELEVALQPGWEHLITIWGATNPELPKLRVDGQRTDASMELHLGYGRDARAWDQIDLALDRLGQYGPPWRTGAIAVLLLVATIAALALVPFVTGRRLVYALVGLAVAKGVLWSIVVPPLEGVDEYRHVAYAQFMAEQYRIPDRGDPVGGGRWTDVSEELDAAVWGTSSPLLGPEDRPPYGSEADDLKSDLVGLDRRSNGDGPASGYAPHYYLVPALLERTPGRIDQRLGTMRLWSVALGVVVTLLALQIGRRLFPHSELAAGLVAVAVTLHPELSQQTAIVNNDAGVVVAGAWSVLLALDLVAPVRRWPKLAFLAGLAGGLTFVAKGFGVAVVPVLGLAWLVGRFRGQRPVPVWRDLVDGAAGFALGYGTWFVTATVLGLAGVGLSGGEPSPGPRTLEAFFDGLSARGWEVPYHIGIIQFWGAFSWQDVPFPHWTLRVILWACAAGAVLVVAWAGVALARLVRRRLDPELQTTDAQAATLALTVLSMFGVLLAIGFLNFRSVGRFDLIQGRYALLAVPAVLALPAVCLRSLRPRWSPVPAMTVVAAAMLALNLFGLGLITERFYL